jgi:hypothetical protein
MKKNSKCAILKLEELEANGKRFYKATLIENIYNPKNPAVREFASYRCQIYTDLELEQADMSLELDKNKWSFVNISNPEKSIIRILDFEFIIKTKWKGTTQVKNDGGKPIYNEYIAIHDCIYENGNFISIESRLKKAEKKVALLQTENKKLRAENKNLNIQLDKSEATILNKNKKLNTVVIEHTEKKFKQKLQEEPTNIEFSDI